MIQWKPKQIIEFEDLGSPELEITQPEFLSIRFRDGDTYRDLALGLICFLERKHGTSPFFNPETLLPSRYDVVIKLVYMLYDESNLSRKTIVRRFRNFQKFIYWSDKEGAVIFSSADNDKDVLKQYSGYRKDKYQRGELKDSTYALTLNETIKILGKYWGDPSFDRLRVKHTNKDKEPTRPQDDDAIGYANAWLYSVFNDFSDFVLENRSCPVELNVPVRAKWSVEKLFGFPVNRIFMPPHVLERRNELDRPAWFIDYENGTINPDKPKSGEYTKGVRDYWIGGVKRLENSIFEADQDHSKFRYIIAQFAMNAFFYLFLSDTGKNLQTVIDLKWSGNLEPEQTRQGFRGYKNRASKEILFEIEFKFFEYFKKFIKLREWVLNGNECDYLFFNIRNSNNGVDFLSPKKIDSNHYKHVYKWFKSIDPHIPNFNSKQARANSNEYWNRNTTPVIAAEHHDHSRIVHEESYSLGSEGKAAEELSTFFESLVAKPTENVVDHRLGACVNPDNPEKRNNTLRLEEPDCSKPYSCLGCKHFRTHIDDNDVRKLFSCLWLIERTAHLSDSDDHFEHVFGETIRIINSLIDEIRIKGNDEADLIDRIRSEVFEEGKLSQYFNDQFEMLAELGMVSYE